MYNTASIILGGGRGTRLYPLVKERSKPAVPLGGKYRMIDIPISNCINSGIRKIYVLTQFNAASLNNHIYHSYNFDHFSKGFIQILAAEQTDANIDWFQGTADAVRKHIKQYDKDWIDTVMILSGDQLYRMDYRPLLSCLEENNADAVVGTVPVKKQEAKGFGIMRTNNRGQINAFVEKPQEDDVLKKFALRAERKKQIGITERNKNYLASMGIYVFKKEVLFSLLEDMTKIDFGRDIIPYAIKHHKVFSYTFNDYWEDIGTIKAFFDANIALGSKNPPFDFYDEEFPIYTHARYLSGSKIEESTISESLIADGCKISKARIKNSVIGVRSIVRDNTTLDKVVMMGNDAYETKADINKRSQRRTPLVGVGKNCVLRNVIIDKNVSIGDNVKITNTEKIKNMETTIYSIRDGIVVIPKNTVIKSDTVI